MAPATTPKILIESWPVPVLYCVFSLISYAIAYAAARLAKLSSYDRRYLIASTMFSNTNSMPIAVMTGIVSSNAVEYLYLNANDSKEEVLSRWSYGYSLLTQREEAHTISKLDVETQTYGTDTTQSANYSKSRTSLIDNVNSITDDTPLLRKREVSYSGMNMRQRLFRFTNMIYHGMTRPLLAALLAVLVAFIPSLQHSLFAKDSFIHSGIVAGLENCGSASVPIVLICLGAQISTIASEDDEQDTKSVVFLAILCRMIISPILAISVLSAICYCCRDMIALTGDPAFFIVLGLVAAMPTAISLTQIAQSGRAEKLLLRTLFWNYGILLELQLYIVFIFSVISVLVFNSMIPGNNNHIKSFHHPPIAKFASVRPYVVKISISALTVDHLAFKFYSIVSISSPASNRASDATQYQQDYRQRIPQQQGVGQTLPPNPIGSIPHNTPPPPPGAMPPGTQVVVGQHKVVIQVYLAEGGFAHVYLVRMKDFSDPIVLKRIAVPDTERLKSVEKEIVFMRRLGNHKNIVRYFDSQVSPLPTGGFEALILMEYCPGGGVIDLMNRRLQQRLTEPEILKIFGDVSEALAYMHYCNPAALHRDLKVENILISASGRYKLCDFGSACLSKGQYIPKTLPEIQKLEDDIQRHTTLQYRAPEMIDIYQRRPINEKADIWVGISNQFTDDQERRPNIYQVVETVCKLRGKDCPIRNIYANNSVASSPKSQTGEQPKSASERHGSDNIFEQRVQPKQQTPNITPMRRGRPDRKEKENHDHASKEDKVSNDKFDPFDPNLSSPSQRKQPVLDFDPATVFSLNEKTAFTSKSTSSDTEIQNSQSISEKLAAPSAQAQPSRYPSSSVGGRSQSGSIKPNQFQHAAGSSTPDSFKSPSLNPRIQHLTGDSKFLPATPSGGQSISPARTPSPVAYSPNANITGERLQQAVTPSDILKNSKLESSSAASSPVRKFEAPTISPDVKANQFADLNPKIAAQAAPPRSMSMQAGGQVATASNASRASFDKIRPNLSSTKGDSVDDFNLKFPDLSSLEQHFSGASNSSRKNDGSAAFAALDKFDNKADKQHAPMAKSNRHSVFDRYSSPTEETKASPNRRRSSMNSTDMNSKGNQIQSKVKEQLQRFEMANNERKSAEQHSQRLSTKITPSAPKSESNDVKSQENKLVQPRGTEWQSPIQRERSPSSSHTSSAKEPSSELAEMKKSLQSYRQMLQSPSPSPSPKDDTATFDFANARTSPERFSSSAKSPTKSPVSSAATLVDATPSRSSTKSPQEIASLANRKKEDTAPSKSASPSPKSVPATQTGPYRPTPPPKPARFRMSSTMVPVLTPSSTSNKSEAISSPRNLVNNSQHLLRTKLSREPSISEFESKFPSPEQLQEGLTNDS
ncbi:hypothetical protein NQZ79_g878 [Umbelopsis isabellina]|nr:hypothetical protein NQZ79_g878 [Umbelopsis isabellina]